MVEQLQKRWEMFKEEIESRRMVSATEAVVRKQQDDPHYLLFLGRSTALRELQSRIGQIEAQTPLPITVSPDVSYDTLVEAVTANVMKRMNTTSPTRDPVIPRSFDDELRDAELVADSIHPFESIISGGTDITSFDDAPDMPPDASTDTVDDETDVDVSQVIRDDS